MKRFLLIACILVVVAACSKKSTPPGNTGASAADTPVTIVATDSGFTLPDTLHAGLNHIVYENHGTEVHECHFIRLPEGMSTADYVAEVKKDVLFPAGALDCSGPGLTSPGERVEMWFSLDEGNYLVGCWMTNHMTTRRPVGIVVHGTPAKPVEPPHEDVTVRMIDFRYEFLGKLKSGDQIIRYETVGPSMHETDVVRLADDRKMEDVKAWFKDQHKTLPGVIGGGCLDSHDLKHVVWMKHTFQPGRYVFWCDMPMMQTATPQDTTKAVTHADAGMYQEVSID